MECWLSQFVQLTCADLSAYPNFLRLSKGPRYYSQCGDSTLKYWACKLLKVERNGNTMGETLLSETFGIKILLWGFKLLSNIYRSLKPHHSFSPKIDAPPSLFLPKNEAPPLFLPNLAREACHFFLWRALSAKVFFFLSGEFHP